MSVTKNKAIRCDWCGKISGNQDGEYTKPDGVAGYIHQPEWERFPDSRTDISSVESDRDICEECAANLCPACGSEAIVSVTSSGPLGFGGRCKVCKHQWSMPVQDEPGAARGEKPE